jgi:hypothetical protein
MRRVLALFIGLICIESSWALAPAPAVQVETTSSQVSEVLAKARAAIGWQAVHNAAAVRVRGAAQLMGTEARQTELFDAQGRWLQTFEGPLPGANGSDGETLWSVDWTGTPRTLALGDQALAQVGAALMSGSWVRADATIAFESVQAGEGTLTLPFTHGAGVLKGWLQLDATTFLPSLAKFGQGSEETTWTFSGYTDHAGYRYPSGIKIEREHSGESFTTATVELLESFDVAQFAVRSQPPGDTRFDYDVSPVLETMRVPSGHVLVHPRVDGMDLGWFIFDSGAGTNCISTHVATQLAKAPFGEIPARGIGGTVMTQFWRAGALQLGPVTIEDPIFMGLDLTFLEGPFGVKVGGIIGYEFIARCAVEVDLDSADISVYDPSDYELDEAGTWEDILLYSRHPCVRAEFEGRSGIFKIDTGAAGDTVTMHYQVVQDLALIEGRETQPSSAGGVGGSVSVRTGMLESFKLGGHDFGTIRASFTVEDQGAFSDDYTMGNIGGQLIKPFTLVFDYANQRMGFLPKSGFE